LLPLGMAGVCAGEKCHGVGLSQRLRERVVAAGLIVFAALAGVALRAVLVAACLLVLALGAAFGAAFASVRDEADALVSLALPLAARERADGATDAADCAA